jgi:protein translocase SecG subunit
MFLQILEIIVTLGLVGSILLQSQGSGLSTSFGGGGEFYRSKQSIEKLLIGLTVVLSILFCILSVLLLIFSK